MSKETFIGGDLIQKIGGSNKVFVNGDYVISGKNVIFNAADGIKHGDPEKAPERRTKYILKGEWKDRKNNNIKKARVGDYVQFCIETKNIPEKKNVKLKLREYDGSIYIPLLTLYSGIGYTETRPFDDDILISTTDAESKKSTPLTQIEVDKNGKASFGIHLAEDLDQMISEDTGSFIELYFNCSYEEGGEFNVYLPKITDNYLQVEYSDRRLFIESAAGSTNYGLPEFRTSDGDILIFSGGITKQNDDINNNHKEEEENNLDRFGNKIKDKAKDKIKDEAIDRSKDLLEKGRTAIAVHQLKLKKVAFTDGVVRQKRKLYNYKVFDNAGEEYSIMKASNYSFKNAKGEVVTSKGISQLDYFRETNIYSKMSKIGMTALECLSFLDLAKFLSGNGEQGQIPSPIPALDFVIGLMLENTKEQIKEMTDEAVQATLETAKSLGIAGVQEFLTLNANDKSFSSSNIKDVGLKVYQTIDISQDTLEKLLSGKIRKVKQLKDLKELTEKQDGEKYRKAEDQPFKSSLNYQVFLRSEYDEKISNDIFIVETIFVKN